ncbi:vimentin-type intermediate filament-associated coiled-coil protein-like [Sinocyclocheilus rhinocerous]|uniref:Vimentin-type intermediate filament-associated coiled-coil protein-like n=1 Tax=Sinocyclocheilus rhinocerous TaxID=307959 RepID=A0A673LLT9_9TELE|nr:PREDICTED: vimentin-type intermediate filament-associated coiled-coil protein-like [Sinocyclocheilus rhinocerous]
MRARAYRTGAFVFRILLDMSSPSPVQIREANAHLAALHRRVTDLEQRLEEAEKTVREQAESLIRKDEQLRAATQEITEAKDKEIFFLHEKLCQSEESIHKLNQTFKEKDSLIAQLQHRCQLLDSICKSRPLLDSMLAQMAEAERTGKPTTNSSFTDGESNCSPSRLSNHKDFSLSEDDSDDQELDGVVFGTTV